MCTRYTLFGVVVLALLVASCAPPAVDMAALRKTIDDYNAASSAAMVAGTVDSTVLAYYAEDAVEMPPNEAMIKGKEAIHQWITNMSQGPMKTKSMTFTPTDVQAAGNVAYEIGTYAWVGSMGEGTPDIPDNGKYIAVWKMGTDGAWKVAAEIWNTDTPPPAPEPPADAKKK
jgi:ketosteroid isomerase-like protein